MKTREYLLILRRVDFGILVPTLLLMAVGLLSIYSATHASTAIVHYEKQYFWMILGILILMLVVITPHRFYNYSAYFFYALSITALLLVLFFGKSVGGSAGWFRFGNFGVQPAEFAKIGMILALARFLSDNQTRISSIKDLSTAVGILFLPWLMILLQPDFGSSLIYLIIFIPIIFWAGAEMLTLLVLISPVIIAIVAIFDLWFFLAATIIIVSLFYLLRRNVGVALIFLSLNLTVGFAAHYLYDHLPAYQRDRIAVYLDPAKDPQAAGYNVIQSKVAIGSGGLTGKGYLQGSQTQLRFIPEQWTDFIFCVPAEEFGFLGAALVLLLYAVIIYRGLRIAFDHTSPFASLLCIGIVSTMAVHVFINIGMALGLLPVIGIPLPFVSYGGSSLLTNLIMVGLLLHSYSYRTGFE